jgi:hypothetical protein
MADKEKKVTTEVETSKKEVTPVVEPKKRNSDWWKWLLGLLILAFMIPICLGVGLASVRQAQYVFSSPKKVDPIPPAAEEVKVVAPANQVVYLCVAEPVGTPVNNGGSCSYCTINYHYPGDVFVVREKAMEYTSGAWVYQYPMDSLEGFKQCIAGQAFMSDSKYTAIWK